MDFDPGLGRVELGRTEFLQPFRGRAEQHDVVLDELGIGRAVEDLPGRDKTLRLMRREMHPYRAVLTGRHDDLADPDRIQAGMLAEG